MLGSAWRGQYIGLLSSSVSFAQACARSSSSCSSCRLRPPGYGAAVGSVGDRPAGRVLVVVQRPPVVALVQVGRVGRPLLLCPGPAWLGLGCVGHERTPHPYAIGCENSRSSQMLAILRDASQASAMSLAAVVRKRFVKRLTRLHGDPDPLGQVVCHWFANCR